MKNGNKDGLMILNAYRMTKIFYPKPHSNKAKCKLKLERTEIKILIEIITGQNNLNYMNNKE